MYCIPGKHKGAQVDWMDARGEEISLWQSVIDHPNSWIDAKLPLRASMGKTSKKWSCFYCFVQTSVDCHQGLILLLVFFVQTFMNFKKNILLLFLLHCYDFFKVKFSKFDYASFYYILSLSMVVNLLDFLFVMIRLLLFLCSSVFGPDEQIYTQHKRNECLWT